MRYPLWFGLFTGLLFLSLQNRVHSQHKYDTYRESKLIPPRVLERLHLNMRWNVNLPLEGKFDSIATVQSFGNQVFVQLLSGKLVVFNLDNGEKLWQYSFSKKYRNVYPVAVSFNNVFLVNGIELFALDRKTGLKVFSQLLPSAPSTGPVVDVQAVFQPLANERIVAYQHTKLLLPSPPGKKKPDEPIDLGINTVPHAYSEFSSSKHRAPSVSLLHTLKPPYNRHGKDSSPSLNIVDSVHPPFTIDGASRSPSITIFFSLAQLGELMEVRLFDVKPTKWFEELVAHGMIYQPLIDRNLLLVPTTDRLAIGLSKAGKKINFEFDPDALISAPPSLYVAKQISTAYIPANDGNLFAVNLENGKMTWRYNAGSAVTQKPYVTDDTIFVGSRSSGLTLINREKGEKYWTNLSVNRVLTINPKYVYATDPSNRLHILDRRRGISLSNIDISSFQYPVVNEENDRLFLAGHNGLLICLHDLEYKNPVTPIVMNLDVKEIDIAPEEMQNPAPKKDPVPKKDPAPKEDPAPKDDPAPKKDN